MEIGADKTNGTARAYAMYEIAVAAMAATMPTIAIAPGPAASGRAGRAATSTCGGSGPGPAGGGGGPNTADGPPPYQGIWNAPKYTDIFGPKDDEMRALVAKSGPPTGPALVGMTNGSEYGLADQVSAQLGLAVTFAVVYDQPDKVDLSTQALSIGVPVYFVEGRYDQNSTPSLAVDYLNRMTAPSKQVVWFERSGHDPAHDEPAAFNQFMVDTVLVQNVP